MNITYSKIKLVDTFYKADSFKGRNISIILGDVALLRYSVQISCIFELTISVYRRFCFIVCVYTYNKGVIRIDSYEMKMVQVGKRHLWVSFFCTLHLFNSFTLFQMHELLFINKKRNLSEYQFDIHLSTTL